MAADYYIGEPSEEWEVVERWENEGGRLRQNDDGQRRSNRVGRKISSVEGKIYEPPGFKTPRPCR